MSDLHNSTTSTQLGDSKVPLSDTPVTLSESIFTEGATRHSQTSVDLPKEQDTELSQLYPDGNDDELIYTPFSETSKKLMVAVTGVTGMLAPFASNIFLPALPSVAEDLNSTVSRINVAVSVFMIGMGLAPIFFGPMADQFGRRYPNTIGCAIAVAASVGCALANSDSLLLGMRFLQAFGASTTVVVGAGIISDIYEPAQRGTALGFFFSAQMLGPVLGTVIGGYIADGLGWRWTFWLTAIISGISLILLTFVMPETHRVTVARRRKIPLKGLPEGIHLQPRPPLNWQQVNPFVIAPTMKFPYVAVPVACMALIFGAFYSMNTAVSTILSRDYGYSVATIGLCYISIGAGCITGSVVSGFMTDFTFNRAVRRRQSVSTEDTDVPTSSPGEKLSVPATDTLPFEARLPFLVGTMTLFPIGLVTFGWLMHYKVHIAVPLVFQFIVGFCLNGSFGGFSTYLVDIFTAKSSSITSLANLFRCLYTALWTGVIEIVMESWGTGWAFVFLAFTCVVGSAITILLYLKGETWRYNRPPTAFLQIK
ncbi:hypothetical protein IWQ62_001761 [Dispira parvispora]|uniref:Major facilitator superfamily (MFS) profile domain-containing protein n=1 Tax=Dispira parvispora TaxID=1520584 RepID=A0A9W8E7V0_9FUNG|nr:hypothetical protein IWQ62_001761 [Dispira parvispora]